MIYLFIGLVVCIGIVLFFIRYAYKKKIKKHYDDLLLKRNKELEEELANKRQKMESDYALAKAQQEQEFIVQKAQLKAEYDGLILKYESAVKGAEQQLNSLKLQTNQQATVLSQFNEAIKTQAEEYKAKLYEEAEKSAKLHEETMLREALKKMQLELEGKTKEATEQHEQMLLKLSETEKEQLKKLEEIKNIIDDYSSKQTAINEAIIRQRELEEQQDFYRVCLAPESIADISILQSVKQNLKKPEIVDKIIYDNYVAKPVLEMIKRVLSNESFSGIYKITCLKTNEIYIGKSTDIKSRWQQHCKTAFNCGTIASSLLHLKMKQYGLENFTFEIVEKVSKDQLSEREKFYIEFYKTKEYGLNEKKG